MSLRSKIDVIKKKNEALIFNILPAHVAKDFIGTKRKHEVRLFLYFVTTMSMSKQTNKLIFCRFLREWTQSFLPGLTQQCFLSHI